MLLSQRQDGGTLVIPPSTRAQWTIQQRFDRIRKINDRFYEIDRSELRPLCCRPARPTNLFV